MKKQKHLAIEVTYIAEKGAKFKADTLVRWDKATTLAKDLARRGNSVSLIPHRLDGAPSLTKSARLCFVQVR